MHLPICPACVVRGVCVDLLTPMLDRLGERRVALGVGSREVKAKLLAEQSE